MIADVDVSREATRQHAGHYAVETSTYRYLLFFFQAEDGIRDLTVTGVQTCALPISSAAATPGAARTQTRNARAARLPASMTITHPERVIDPSTGITKMDLARYYAKIGRASCRERV